MNKDLIIGIHSIKAALENPNRASLELFTTKEKKSEFGQIKENVKINLHSTHQVQELAKGFARELEHEIQRVPGQSFLLADTLPELEASELYELINSQSLKRLLALDQVSDVHNAGAIVRTASFYGVDAIILPNQKSFGMPPAFFRNASGGIEDLKIVRSSSLSKTLNRLKGKGCTLVGLSEHADTELGSLKSSDAPLCLILGKEETGISNAVMRTLDYQMALRPQGLIRSLNVSVAAAVAMEQLFG